MLVSPWRTIVAPGAVASASSRAPRARARWRSLSRERSGTRAERLGDRARDARSAAIDAAPPRAPSSPSPNSMFGESCGIFTCASGAPSATRFWRSAWYVPGRDALQHRRRRAAATRASPRTRCCCARDRAVDRARRTRAPRSVVIDVAELGVEARSAAARPTRRAAVKCCDVVAARRRRRRRARRSPATRSASRR